jgi:hypothetical protein
MPSEEELSSMDYKGIWKIRQIFDILSLKFSGLYRATEQVTVD